MFVMSERAISRSMLLTPVLLAAGFVLTALHPETASAHADKRAEGAELFATRGCAHCHGDTGEGTERAPALLQLRKKLSEQKIQDQIVHGGQGMPAFGESLNAEEVDSLVRFLRAKKWVSAPKPAAAPAP
jgi:mono/diheme cytochrome c family protein